MSKFNIGDIVVGNHPDKYGVTKLGWEGMVVSISESSGTIELINQPGHNTGTYTVKPEYFDLKGSTIKSTNIKSIMTNLTKKFRLLTKSEPEKTFIEKGVMDDQENLTAEGRALFEAFLIKKLGAEFKTEVVDKLVDEDKK